MDYKIIKLPKSEIEIEVVLPFLEFEPHIKRAAVLLSEENDIEGFRRGRAPYDVVKNRFGENVIYERAAEIAVKKTYPSVLDRLFTSKELASDHPPIGKPEITITKLAPGNELEYKVKTAILPEVKLPDYNKIAKRVLAEKKEVSVKDEDVAKALDWIREARAPMVTVNREAKAGDRVEIDFEIRQGVVKIEKGESRNHPAILGKGKFIPGFEEALMGMRAGESKEFSLEVPATWHEKNLAGKKLDFKVSVKLVQEIQLPELTDEFAKGLGDFKSVEDLRNNVRTGMLKEQEDKEKERIRVLIIEGIAKEAEVDIPDVLIEAEIEKMLEELKSGVEGMGMKLTDYLLHLKKTEDDLKKEWRPEAEKRVRIAFCLREIARLEKIEPSGEEVEARVNQFLAQFRSAEDADKKVDPEGLREYTRGILRNEKVFELLEAIS